MSVQYNSTLACIIVINNVSLNSILNVVLRNISNQAKSILHVKLFDVRYLWP